MASRQAKQRVLRFVVLRIDLLHGASGAFRSVQPAFFLPLQPPARCVKRFLAIWPRGPTAARVRAQCHDMAAGGLGPHQALDGPPEVRRLRRCRDGAAGVVINVHSSAGSSAASSGAPSEMRQSTRVPSRSSSSRYTPCGTASVASWVSTSSAIELSTGPDMAGFGAECKACPGRWPRGAQPGIKPPCLPRSRKSRVGPRVGTA